MSVLPITVVLTSDEIVNAVVKEMRKKLGFEGFVWTNAVWDCRPDSVTLTLATFPTEEEAKAAEVKAAP